MNSQDPHPKRWAILIGVGLTLPRPGARSTGPANDISLPGAVEDIRAAAEYLETGPSAIDMSIFTATKSPQNGRKAIEAKECLPSHGNVISSMQRVLKLSSPGDHVYIHYSGHGTVRSMDSAVALELINPTSLETEYLYSTILRNAIYKMIQRGLTVTLVLDCCFSGSVLRDDQLQARKVRYLEYDGDVDLRCDYRDPFYADSSRDSELGLARLLDPEGHTIIAACGPHEVASELEFDGGATRGALSYFLVDSLTKLRRRGIKISNEMLHQNLRAQFHARVPEQTPMLYGNRGFAFFGDFVDCSIDAHLPTFSLHRSMEHGGLVLHAGQAHGVHRNDEYALSPFEQQDEARQPTIRGRIDAVDCLTSTMSTVDPEDAESIKRGSTWKASLVTSFSPKKVHIHLDCDVLDSNNLIQAASSTSYLVLSQELCAEKAENSVFRISMDEQSTYQVRHLTPTGVKDVANIPSSRDSSHRNLLDTLHHIANYKYFEGIDNRLSSQSLERSFSLSTTNTPGPDGYYLVKHGKELLITFVNLTHHPLYLGIFLFTQLWEVRNLVSEKGEDAYLTVLPRTAIEIGKIELPLTMTVPDELLNGADKQTEDIIKIFITSQPFVFPGLMLPRLGHVPGHRGELDPFSRLLQDLQGNQDGDREDKKCEWTTRSYLVRTHI
ncbi:hypothetical protein LCI18_008258 [Fusarium solani-melongenae]|uniref:Uncharacterized protein n=1 Tax=Fusarium solani subsp. cucurbitae TaxID=2747967 RepID=A0ACD3ZB57_FUSSC|nr:hypothetical protein LCI18_008258 [Fusarium solani-melongenae]